MKRYDAVMIGFGKGAKTLAADLAGEGLKVAIVEQSEKMYGGTCINVGCIPTKSLVNSAKRSLCEGGDWAIKRARYAEAIAEKNRLTAALRQKNYDKIANNSNAEVIAGRASFVDAHTLEVETKEGKIQIWGDKIFINTGSAAFVPPIDGVKESKRVYTSETLMETADLPERLVIVGGGYIGLEFASFYANFGSAVTVLQNGPDFIPREDREIAAEILKVMSRKIDFRFGAQIESVRDTAEKTIVRWTENGEKKELAANAVLIATGRRPNTSGLRLEAAGVETERGAVKVDAGLKTSAENIRAMGDCKGGLLFTYISLDDYRIVKSQLTGGDRTTENRGAVPYSVFIDPPFSHIGLTELQAKEKGIEILVAKLPVAAIPKAQVLKSTDGLLKAVIEKSTGKILGASLFCEESHEMINLIKLAMDAGLPYTMLRDRIYTHPTMSESFNDLFASAK